MYTTLTEHFTDSMLRMLEEARENQSITSHQFKYNIQSQITDFLHSHRELPNYALNNSQEYPK